MIRRYLPIIVLCGLLATGCSRRESKRVEVKVEDVQLEEVKEQPEPPPPPPPPPIVDSTRRTKK